MRKLLLFFVLFFFGFAIFWSILPQPWRRAVDAKMGWKSFVANEEAQAQFKGQDYSMALNKWNEALARGGNRPDLLYNLSLGLQLLQKGEDAFKSYSGVLKDPRSTDELKFMSYFNRGVMAQANKDVDGALVEYQAALDLNPESIETKTNIEMLFQGGQGKGKGDQGKGNGKDDQQQDGGNGKDKKDENKPKEYAKNPKPQPKQFKSEQLDQSDVNKILGELRQQEQKIRSEFNKREVKEQPRDKDW